MKMLSSIFLFAAIGCLAQPIPGPTTARPPSNAAPVAVSAMPGSIPRRFLPVTPTSTRVVSPAGTPITVDPENQEKIDELQGKQEKVQASLEKLQDKHAIVRFEGRSKDTKLILKTESLVEDLDIEQQARTKDFANAASLASASRNHMVKQQALDKLLSDPETTQEQIRLAKLNRDSARFKQIQKVYQATRLQSYKADTDAGRAAMVKDVSNLRAKQFALQQELQKEDPDEQRIASLERAAKSAGLKTLAQYQYMEGEPKQASMAKAVAAYMFRPSAQEKVDQAWQAYNEDPTLENDIKLEIAELELKLVNFQGNEVLVEYYGHKTDKLNSRHPLLNAFLAKRSYDIKEEITFLKEELLHLEMAELSRELQGLLGTPLVNPLQSFLAPTQPFDARFIAPRPMYNPYYILP